MYIPKFQSFFLDFFSRQNKTPHSFLSKQRIFSVSYLADCRGKKQTALGQSNHLSQKKTPDQAYAILNQNPRAIPLPESARYPFAETGVRP
jgi:hypothetical protein